MPVRHSVNGIDAQVHSVHSGCQIAGNTGFASPGQTAQDDQNRLRAAGGACVPHLLILKEPKFRPKRAYFGLNYGRGTGPFQPVPGPIGNSIQVSEAPMRMKCMLAVISGVLLFAVPAVKAQTGAKRVCHTHR